MEKNFYYFGDDIAGGDATGLGLIEVGIDAPETICAGIKSFKFRAFSFALFERRIDVS